MKVKKESSVAAVYKYEPETKVIRPLFSTGVSAGFPSPADDFIEQRLDLNEHLIRHPAATFFVRVAGDSMVDAGIHHDDILIVDRSMHPRDKKIVIAVLDGELTVKRLVKNGNGWRLKAENAAYPPLDVNEDQQFEVWGVVTYAIHKLS
jgi:DNA polymerase V